MTSLKEIEHEYRALREQLAAANLSAETIDALWADLENDLHHYPREVSLLVDRFRGHLELAREAVEPKAAKRRVAIQAAIERANARERARLAKVRTVIPEDEDLTW